MRAALQTHTCTSSACSTSGRRQTAWPNPLLSADVVAAGLARFHLSSLKRRHIHGRHQVVSCRASSAVLGLDSGFGAVQSADPMAVPALFSDACGPGLVCRISGPDDLEQHLQMHPSTLTVLMCKAKACRPCKMFTRKYARLAARFPEVVMLEVTGDESTDTRKMMMSMGIKVTPTFRLFDRNGNHVDVTGTNEQKLMRAIMERLSPTEQAAHPDALAELQKEQEQQQQAAQQ